MGGLGGQAGTAQGSRWDEGHLLCPCWAKDELPRADKSSGAPAASSRERALELGQML